MSKKSRNLCHFLSLLGFVLAGNMFITPSSKANLIPCVCAVGDDYKNATCHLSARNSETVLACDKNCRSETKTTVWKGWLEADAEKKCNDYIQQNKAEIQNK